MIKTFKRVERTGRLTACCRENNLQSQKGPNNQLHSVYNDKHFESIGARAPPNFVNDKRYL